MQKNKNGKCRKILFRFVFFEKKLVFTLSCLRIQSEWEKNKCQQSKTKLRNRTLEQTRQSTISGEF